jgi:hypothetical protein
MCIPNTHTHKYITPDRLININSFYRIISSVSLSLKNISFGFMEAGIAINKKESLINEN